MYQNTQHFLLYFIPLLVLNISLYLFITFSPSMYLNRMTRRHSSSINTTDNCTELITQTQSILSQANISLDCSPMRLEGCQQVYNTIYEKADPLSVFLRSSTCELDMPSYSRVSMQEKEFPLAYLFLSYNDARNVELTLSTVFRPHNAYCIHIDPKGGEVFIRTIQQIISCYKAKYPHAKIFQSSTSVPVYWGHFSNVEAELACMRDLLNLDMDWQYLLNMAGSELMLSTNKELVTQLSSTPKHEIYADSKDFGIEAHWYRVDKIWMLNEDNLFNPDQVP